MYLQVLDDPLGDLLIELSSTSTTTRWSERRRPGRPTTALQRPRAASCSRRLASDTPALAAALPSKSLSHSQLHRNPSNCSDLDHVDSNSVQLRHKSHQKTQPVRTSAQHSTHPQLHLSPFLLQSSKMGIVTKGFDARLANQPF